MTTDLFCTQQPGCVLFPGHPEPCDTTNYARQIADGLGLHPDANPGLMTTRQLLRELKARGDVAGHGVLSAHAHALLELLPSDILDYRTVGT